MDTAITILYAEYGRYISRFRAIPYYIDILRPIERRMLLSSFEIAKSLTKSAKVMGHCMGSYHPHTVPYSTLVKLVKQGFLEGQGNFGFDGLIPIEAAAPRYTEIKLKNWVIELAFKYLDYVDWINFEFENEPEFLPSPIPVGLIGNDINQGIAFHKTVMPQYKLEDLVKRLKFLLGKIKTEPVILPNYLDHKCIPNKQELKVLKHGNGQVNFITNYTKIDNSNYEINGVPLSKSKFIKFIEDGKLSLNDYSSKEIKLSVKGKIDEKKLIESLTSNVNFQCIVVNNDNLVSVNSIDEILIRNYEKFKSVFNNYLNKTHENLKLQLEELKVIKEIKQVLSNHKIDTVDQLVKLCKSPENLIRQVSAKYSISRLVNVKTDLDDTQNKIDQTQDKLNNIENETYSILDSIKGGSI